MVELGNLLKELEQGMRIHERKPKVAWGRIKAAMKDQEIGRLVNRLKRKKCLFEFAAMTYLG